MYVDENQLGNFVIDLGLISRRDWLNAEKVAQEVGQSVSTILVKKGYLGADDLRRAEAHILGIPFLDLKNRKFTLDALSAIPEPLSRIHSMVAIDKRDNEVEVALLHIKDLEYIEFLRSEGIRILPRLTGVESIKYALLSYQELLKRDYGEKIQKESSFGMILKHALAQRASDIHLEPEEDKLLVRYRIHGSLRDAVVLPTNLHEKLTREVKTLAEMNVAETRIPQEGRFSVEEIGERTTLRISTLPTYYGEKVVIRILREHAYGFTLESLGFKSDALEVIHNVLNEKQGIILSTGTLGAGKTTTVYTMLDILNSPATNISTIEDPIEYHLKRVNQTQVRPEVGLDYIAGIRSINRQDADVVMIGEFVDRDVANLALQTATSGKLVLSTFVAGSASGAVTHLLGMGLDPVGLASNLRVVTCQRLVKSLRGTKNEYFLSKDELRKLSSVVDLERMLKILNREKVVKKNTSWEKIPFYKPGSKGYGDAIGIYEVLKVTPTIGAMIKEGTTTAVLEERAKEEGMITMLEDGIIKAAQGLTTVEEVLSTISN